MFFKLIFYRLIGKITNADRSLIKWNYIHFIGHSLGAHVSGQAARKLKNKKSITVNRITGLDPAYPCFVNDSSSLKLRKSDATFVDIIHTNSRKGINNNFGTYDQCGK